MSNIDPKTSADASLSAALRELASSAPQSAPPELGDSLMRSFHRHHLRRRVVRATSLYLAILAVFGGSLLWVRTQSTRTLTPSQSVAAINANSKPAGRQEPGRIGTAVSPQPTQQSRLGIPLTPVFAHTETASSARRSSSLHHLLTPSGAAVAQNNTATQGLFVELPSFAFCSPNEELRVIRVNMPMSSLRLLGAPIDEESMNRRVTTDLLIGSDGTPYAVRLVM